MKILNLILLLILSSPDYSSIEEIRTLYHKIENEKELESFINITKNSNCNTLKPYLAAAIMQRAKYAFWPTKKLKNFNQGKKILELYIKNNPTNIEARYIRVLVQSVAPKFLGYTKNIELDLEFINQNIDDSQLPNGYKKIILENISNISK